MKKDDRTLNKHSHNISSNRMITRLEHVGRCSLHLTSTPHVVGCRFWQRSWLAELLGTGLGLDVSKRDRTSSCALDVDSIFFTCELVRPRLISGVRLRGPQWTTVMCLKETLGFTVMY